MKKINSKYGDLTLKIYSYTNNKRIAILLYAEDGELFDDLTINLSDFMIQDESEGFINDFINSSEFDIVEKLKKSKVIEESFGSRNYNMGKYEYVKFNLDKLKEYDPEGLEKFINGIE